MRVASRVVRNPGRFVSAAVCWSTLAYWGRRGSILVRSAASFVARCMAFWNAWTVFGLAVTNLAVPAYAVKGRSLSGPVARSVRMVAPVDFWAAVTNGSTIMA